jgi:hypothetical protein
LKTKLKDRHFNTTEVTEEETHALLNMSQSMTSMMLLNKGRSNGNGAYAKKRTTLRVMVANRLKLLFNQMATPIPEIMDESGIPLYRC